MVPQPNEAERFCEEFTCDYDAPACFPASSVLTTVGGPKRMSDLEIGDAIGTPAGTEQIFTFIHRYEFYEFEANLPTGFP